MSEKEVEKAAKEHARNHGGMGFDHTARAFHAGALWQSERDALRIAELERQVGAEPILERNRLRTKCYEQVADIHNLEAKLTAAEARYRKEHADRVRHWKALQKVEEALEKYAKRDEWVICDESGCIKARGEEGCTEFSSSLKPWEYAEEALSKLRGEKV